MFIQSLTVKGYRNFSDTCIAFHKGLNVIIGANNSGKTNLLNAIRLIRQQDRLGFNDFNMNSMRQAFDTGDYKKEPMKVELLFDIRHEIRLKEEPTDESILKLSDFLSLTDDMVGDTDPDVFPITALVKMEYQIDETRLGEYREKVQNITTFSAYVDLFKTLVSDYRWHFWNASTDRPVDSSVAKGIFEVEYIPADRSNLLLKAGTSDLYKVMLTKTPIDKNRITAMVRTLIGQETASLLAEVNTTVGKDYREIGIDKGNVQIKPVVDFSQDLNELLGFGVSDTEGDYELPFENNGLGYNNLIAIYLILMCRDSVNPQIHSMVLLEEPEAHLHPTMQYKLFKYINHLQERDRLRQQVFVTTHSSNITAVTSIDSIIDMHYDREIKPNNVTTINLSDLFGDANRESKGHIRKFLDVTRSDMLFADSVVLAEGITEKLLLPILLEKEGFGTDDNHVSVVEVGGRWFKHFLHLFDKRRKTKVCCITDCDYRWVISDKLNTEDYSAYAPSHVTELRSLSAENQYIHVCCQGGTDWGSTFEDQLILDNWSIAESVRKRLFKYVFPEALIEYLDEQGFRLGLWVANASKIRVDTQGVVVRLMQPLFEKYNAVTDKAEKDKWEALAFAILFKEYAKSQKGNLALYILTDEELLSALVTPRYIREGAEWLKN